MKKNVILCAVLAVPLFASAATNLITNGSFETGLTGWTTTSTPASPPYPPSILTFGPGAAFGETVLADAAGNSQSPDAVGTHAVYFVDDASVQTLSQSFTVATAGNYLIGFSTYAPANGQSNPNGSSFAAQIDANAPILSTQVGSLATAQWKPTSGVVFLSAATHTISFTFTSTGFPSKDLIVDRAFVTAVPEPESLALMLAGLGAVGFMVRRRRS